MKLRFKLLILPAVAGILMLALCVLVTVLSHRFDNEISSLRKEAAAARAATSATSNASFSPFFPRCSIKIGTKDADITPSTNILNKKSGTLNA